MGVQPENCVIDTNNTQKIIEGIITKYKRHPSILKIKNIFDSSIPFNFSKAEIAYINVFLKQADPKKATGPDTILPKLLKMSANVIGKHLWIIINMDIDNYNVPDNNKVATVRPTCKKKSRNGLENYRPVSLLNAFSETY